MHPHDIYFQNDVAELLKKFRIRSTKIQAVTPLNLHNEHCN